ncbi:hypothetical protein T492DRAFT_954794 [Pavlovales sp. CCMP2436]|nr:hypothetical protein T492DRAFT_954794 [Pavlovales sp. CCMP2436]
MLVEAAAGQANLQSHGFGNGRPLEDLLVPVAAAYVLNSAWRGEQRFKVTMIISTITITTLQGRVLVAFQRLLQLRERAARSGRDSRMHDNQGREPAGAFAPRDVDAAPGLADAIKAACARLVMWEAYPSMLTCVLTADIQVRYDGESRHQPTAGIPSLSQRMLVAANELPRSLASAGNGAGAVDMSAQAAETASLLEDTRTKYAAEAYAPMSKGEGPAASKAKRDAAVESRTHICQEEGCDLAFPNSSELAVCIIARRAAARARSYALRRSGELVEVVDDEEAENKALESLRNAGPPDSARASEFIGGLTVGASLGSDGVLNAVNSIARAERGLQRGGALEGLVETTAGRKWDI